MSSGGGLRRFAAAAAAAPGQARPAPLAGDASPSVRAGPETCEMCAAEIPAGHGHLADVEQSTLICACRACYLLFTHSQAGRGRYRAVPDRYRGDPAHPLSVADWNALEIPVGLAFFLRRSAGGEVTGFYPSPAGATECRLDLQAWQRIEGSHPMIAAAEPDVEAVLIYRADAGDSRPTYRREADVECFLVPIDACYELAGRMRLLWRGFDGGSEARASIAEFIDGVRSRSRAFSREP